jgi:hypothetical protein
LAECRSGIRKPGSPTFWRASPSIPSKGSTNCCHGIGALPSATLIKQPEPKMTRARSSPDAYTVAEDVAVKMHHARAMQGSLFLEALRYDQSLLLGRPPSPPALPLDHLDTTIRITFLPGIKHGICHRLTSNVQLMPGCIAGESANGQVGASSRLLSSFAISAKLLLGVSWPR